LQYLFAKARVESAFHLMYANDFCHAVRQ
jgi:hypothetical protein